MTEKPVVLHEDEVVALVSILGAAEAMFETMGEDPNNLGIFRQVAKNMAEVAEDLRTTITTRFNEGRV